MNHSSSWEIILLFLIFSRTYLESIVVVVARSRLINTVSSTWPTQTFIREESRDQFETGFAPQKGERENTKPYVNRTESVGFVGKAEPIKSWPWLIIEQAQLVGACMASRVNQRSVSQFARAMEGGKSVKWPPRIVENFHSFRMETQNYTSRLET